MKMDIQKFKNISFKKRTQCIICNKKLEKPAINLPDFPLTEIYVDEKISEKLGFINQEFHLCDNCGHGQIANVIAPEILYGDNYITRTSTSQSAIESLDVFLEFINKIINNKSFKSIIEIGCNDVYTLKKLKGQAEKLYGIDPILKGKEYKFNDDKIKVFGNFVENINFQELNITPDIVLSSHTLEHIEDPKKLLLTLFNNANQETLFFFQFPGLESLVKNGSFDQIFHQHLNYFSLKSVIYMLEDIGAELIEFSINPYHWGTLMICFKKKNKENIDHTKFQQHITKITNEQILDQYNLFKDSMNLINKRILSLKNENIYGYGAALMLPILNYYIPALTNLKGIIDDDREKQNLYYLNLPLKIHHPEDINKIKNLIIVVTAINSKQVVRAITSKLIDLKVKEIIVPNLI